MLGMLLALVVCQLAAARDFPAPQRVADGVWMLEGARAHFSRANGGDIANTGFIATPAGTVVIDTGPSLRYGQAQRAAARAATGRDVVQVYLTHAHPDHFLGSLAYADVPVQALAETAERIAVGGDALAQNLFRLLGSAMAGTAIHAPTALTPGAVDVGGRRLLLLALRGHSGADLAVFDEATGTLFAGDLVFFERAPTLPDADIAQWLAALDRLAQLPVRVLVPGHGPVVRGPQAIGQTRDYLRWARDALRDAAARGLDMHEAMRLQAPERLRRLAVLREEWHRTVQQRYPAVEEETWRAATGR